MSDPQPPRAVVLVGLMGSGKTTVGRKVARLLSWRFVDGDAEIERVSGRTVADWFAEEGEDRFRREEGRVLEMVLAGASADPVVFGAGGGLVVTATNRDRLKGPDVAVIYLHADPAFLASRTQRKPHRPLLTGDPATVLGDMYQARDGWYREVADAVVEVRPAHEAGQRPKWRLAEQVVEALAPMGIRVAADGADDEGFSDDPA